MPPTSGPSSSFAEQQYETPRIGVNFVPAHKPRKQSNSARKQATSNAAKRKTSNLQKFSSNPFFVPNEKTDEQKKENIPPKRVRKPAQKVAEALRAKVEALSKAKG